tara:strand:- start:9136 stop:9351 length:216 start_codon:yes stop_codon:yes gene_type:complete
MTKNPVAWIIGGVAVIILSLLMADDWYASSGVFYNVLNGSVLDYSVPMRIPVMAGVVSILWGVYLKLKISN